MTRRVYFAAGLLLLAIAGVATWEANHPGEPMYEGRTLSQWLNHHVASSAANPPYGSPGWKKADEALRSIGTNAIPTLLRMISAKDPPAAVLKVVEWTRRRTPIGGSFRYASALNEEAQYAFEKLGARASNAVPRLAQIYEAGVSESSRSCTAQALMEIGRPARPAVPVLLKNLNHTNDQVRFDAVSAISRIGGEPEVIIPAMRTALKDRKLEIRWNASNGLASLHGRARPAVPDLLEAINDPVTKTHPGLKEQFEIAIWRIAPELVGKPCVVEDESPIVVDGVIAGSIDAELNRERHTIIRPHTAVPCVSQLWSSEPRGAVALYRRAADANAEDHLLGQFEILGIGPPGSQINVSVLCIVADRQIVLSARDNSGERFLETRRVK